MRLSHVRTARGWRVLKTGGGVLAILFSGLLVRASVSAEVNIETLYGQALDAYEAEDWLVADSLAEQALSLIQVAEEKRWSYWQERKPEDAFLFGDYVVVLTRSNADDWYPNRIEFYDLSTGRLVRIHDESPWSFWYPFKSEKYLGFCLRNIGSLGYKVLYFSKNDVELPRTINRENIEEFDLPLPFQPGVFGTIEKGPDGLVVTVLDLDAGSAEVAHVFRSSDLYWSLWDFKGKTMGDSQGVSFVDTDTLYRFSFEEVRTEALRALPVGLSKPDCFVDAKFTQVRADTLYVLNAHPASEYNIKTIHLPFPLDLREPLSNLSINPTGEYVAYHNADSLWVLQIAGSSANVMLGTECCLSGTYKFSNNTFWRSDTLYHYGNSGMRVVRGSEILLEIDADNFCALYDKRAGLLYIHQPPTRFYAIDAGTLKTLWSRDYSASHAKVFDYLTEDYLYINYIDGTSLLEARTGNEVFREPTVATRTVSVSHDDRHVLLHGDEFLAIREVRQHCVDKGDLLALRAICCWESGDSTGAVRAAKSAVASGTSLSADLPKRLIGVLNDLGLGKESLRLMGSMALRVDDRMWRDKLEEAGVEALTGPYLADLFGFVATARGIFAVPVDFDPWLIARGEDRRCYWFDSPGYDCEELRLAFSGGGLLMDGVVFYTYEVDSVRHKLIWDVLLLTDQGEFRKLGPLYETPLLAQDQEKVFLPSFTGQGSMSKETPDRALLNMSQCGRRTCLLYTIGIDLTGGGKNWYDTTTRDPIRVGDRYYSHAFMGSVVTEVVKGSQADTLGLQVGDHPIEMGGQKVCNTFWINRIKELFPLRTPLELVVRRGDDTLRFTVLNGVIGYLWANIFKLIEIDPETGEHLKEKELPPGFRIAGSSTSGDLVYCRYDTLLFYDPLSDSEWRVTVEGAEDFYRHDWMRYAVTVGDILLLFHLNKPEVMAIDISRTAGDFVRVLWRQSFEQGYRHSGKPVYCATDDEMTLPVLLSGGTVLLIDIATGTVLARETLPFQNFGITPQIRDGVLYGATAGRVFGWRLAYYNPPFPWQYAGYGALALLPLLIATWPLHRWRVRRLKNRQHRELEQERLRSELETAAAIQRRIVPKPEQLPRIDYFEVYGYNYPSREVSGDYFDIIPMSNGRFGFVICDVAGKGMPAALLVSTLQATFHALFRSGQGLLEIAHQANQIIFHDTAPDQYASGFIGIIDVGNATVETVNAGHQYPLVVRASGELQELVDGGLCFGMFNFSRYTSQVTRLAPADLIYLYTDGVCEAFGPNGQEFGCERLLQIIRCNVGKAPREILNEVENAIRGWTGNGSATANFDHDDFTQLAIQRVA